MPQNNAVQVFEGGWKQLENAIFTTNLKIISNLPESHFVRPDGTSVSVIAGTDIETFPIGLPYYDPDQVGALSDTFTIPDDATPIGHCWNDNGTRLYVVGQTTKTLYQYTVPTPYLPSSIVAASVSLDLSLVTNDVLQVVISRDGDFIFITDAASVYSFPLPTKDDITSFSSSTDTVFTPGAAADVVSFALKREGDKFYVGNTTTNEITEYVTTAPNIIVGATANGNIFTLPLIPPQLSPNSISFRSNGKQFFVLDRLDSSFVRFHLDDFDRDWNISTASYFSNSFGAADSQSIFWKPDGTKFFNLVAAGGANDRIDQFDVPDRWNMTDAQLNVTNFSLDGIANNPRGMWVTPDGLACFVIDSTSDLLVRLNMTTGWDLSTMSDSGIFFDLNGEVNVNTPTGIAFSKDQLKFYVTDSQTDDVVEFEVPAPLDIINAEFVISFDVSTFGDLTEIRLKPDDSLFYIGARAPDRILLFSLPLDGDVSGAVFLQELDVMFLEDNLQSFFVRENDGKKIWVAGQQSDAISGMDMTLEFNNAIITNFGEELTTDAGETIVA